MSLEASLVNFLLRHGVKHRTRPDASIAELRATADRIGRLFPEPPRHVRREEARVAGRDALFLTAEGADPRRTILYLHGGGYVSGTIAMYRDLARRLSQASRARVLLVDYRLAPEHPFPAAIEDAVAAYRFLLERGHAPSSLAIAGDSAGGGLTLATMLSLRDAGDPLPAAAFVMSPWTDLAYTGESHRTNREADPFIRADLIRPTVDRYLRDVHPRTPLASPLFAELHGLPPTLVHVGSTEVLLDDSRRLVSRFEEPGAPPRLRRAAARLPPVRPLRARGACGDPRGGGVPRRAHGMSFR